MMRPVLLLLVPALFAAEPTPIGLTASGKPIEATVSGAGPTVVWIGGLDGNAGRVAASEGVRLIAIPLANPEKARLVFPPTGVAYRENVESHYLWRFLAATAPDLVVIYGDDAGLTAALAALGIPTRAAMPAKNEPIPPSAAHQEMDRRLARTPRQLAGQLSQYYGHDFGEAVYIPAMALIGRLRLGERADVERIAAPFLDGSKDSLAKPTASHLAGHLLFAELGNRRLVERAADLAAKDQSIYNEMSDGVFMGCPILAKAGRFDDALRHLEYMQKLCLRADGLYRHSPLNEAAWGRGNAFPALGTALALSDIPPAHPAHAPMLRAFQAHMAVLAKFQTEDGMWRQVVDLPGVYQEFSATAMIATAMLRGIRRGWLNPGEYQPLVDKAWRAILKRTAPDGRLVDVCEGTGKQKSAEDYLHRAAILDRDPRGGGMALFFATEMMAR